MKIAFWSNVKGKSGVTANTACIAALTSISGCGRSILLENHYNSSNLGNMLITNENLSLLREESSYCSKYGIEYLIRKLYTGMSNDFMINESAIPLLYSKIFYLPQNYIINRDVFEYEFSCVKDRLYNTLETFADYVYTDTESYSNITTSYILNDADIVVVNLCQNTRDITDFFENYPSLLYKAVFLVGKYQHNTGLNIRKIRNEYGIKKDQIGVIPYNMEFESAINSGRMLQFLNRNYLKPDGADNNFFMNQAKRSAFIIRDRYMGRFGNDIL